MDVDTKNMTPPHRVVLVVGACGLDRLLTVPYYPDADAKIRTTAYYEIGGGNAANTASAIARAANASFLKSKNICVKYLGKVGQDEIGQQLMDELEEMGVDISSPLCLRGRPLSTTSFTTILVSEADHTRTCIHTPGTCGELSVADCSAADMDQVFENVVHLHSDSRHTNASLYLAKEATKRGIPVSCDCEKDRCNKDLDELFELSNFVFTNSSCLKAYIERLTKELEARCQLLPLETPSVVCNDVSLDQSTVNMILESSAPMRFLSRWFPLSGRQVVVTHGKIGALHFMFDESEKNKTNAVGMCGKANSICIQGCHGNGNSYTIRHEFEEISSEDLHSISSRDCSFRVQTCGTIKNAHVVDTTGAGDAFIGGFLLVLVLFDDELYKDVEFMMTFASWIAARKLEGPGVRGSLPCGEAVDQQLGISLANVKDTVISQISQSLADE